MNNFSKLMEDPLVRFYGNVFIGRDISVKELRESYHIIILCTGCEQDRSLSFLDPYPDGVYSAREFVSWYNGHPDFSSRTFSLSGSQVFYPYFQKMNINT